MCLVKITYIKFTFFHNYCTYRWKNTSHSSSLQNKRRIVNPLMTIVLSQTSGVHKSIKVMQKLFLLIPHHVSSTPTHHLWTKGLGFKLLATQKEEGTYSSLLCPITHIQIWKAHGWWWLAQQNIKRDGDYQKKLRRQQGSTKRSQTRKRIEERKEEEKGRRSM